MALTYDIVKDKIESQLGDAVQWQGEGDIPCVVVRPDSALKLVQFLYEEEELGFRFLTDLTAVHYPDRKGEELCVVYHLHQLKANLRLRVKQYVPEENPEVFTLTRIFAGANWMERETYDFFGVRFVGHPDLRRILNADEMDYFPLRKQYTLEDPQRTDKDDAMFGR